MTRKELGPDNV